MSRLCISPDSQTLIFHLDRDDEVRELRTRFNPFWHPQHKYWHKLLRLVDKTAMKDFAREFSLEMDVLTIDALNGASPILKTSAETVSTSSGAPDESRPYSPVSTLPDIDLNGFKINLYPYQIEDAKYCVHKKRAIIGDSPGLGKTFGSLAVAYAAQATERFVVVCPNAVKINWARRVYDAIPNITAAVWGSKGGKDANCIIINYESLAKQVEYLIDLNPKLIIFDEIHFLKSGKAQRTKAAAKIAKNIEYRLGLSGTLMLNRPIELATPLDVIGKLEEFGGYYSFAYRYCGAFKQKIFTKVKNPATGQTFTKPITIFNTNGATHLDELHDKLREKCLIRHTKEEVLPDLPEKTRSEVLIPISNRAEYEMAQENLVAYCQSVAADNKAFKDLIKLLPKAEQERRIEERKQEAADTAEKAEQLVLINTLKLLTARGKLEAVTEWLENFLEGGDKMIMFAYHKEIQEALLKAFPKAARIIAEDSIEKREANVDKFLKDGCKLIVCSLKAGGTGIDRLQEANSSLGFVEFGWTPAEHLQAEDRGHRIGRKEKMIAYYFTGENTIDEELQSLLARKQALCDAVLDGKATDADKSMFDDLLNTLINKEFKLVG